MESTAEKMVTVTEVTVAPTEEVTVLAATVEAVPTPTPTPTPIPTTVPGTTEHDMVAEATAEATPAAVVASEKEQSGELEVGHVAEPATEHKDNVESAPVAAENEAEGEATKPDEATDKVPEEKEKPSLLTKMTSFLHKKHHAASEPVISKAPAETTVPAYRFISTMQGHGYPVVHQTVEAAPQPPKKSSSLTALLRVATGGSKKDLPVVAKEAHVPAEAAPVVPAYRFITSMQGHGYPVAPTAPPAPATVKKERSGFMSTLFKQKSKKQAEEPVKEDPTEPAAVAVAAAATAITVRVEAVSASHEGLPEAASAVSTAPKDVATVPAYRFISTMQGHGYPVAPTAAPAATAHSTTPAPKKARRGLLQAFLSMFRRDGKKKSKSTEQLNGDTHAPHSPVSAA